MSDLQKLIMKFLDAATREPPPKTCSACGAAMKIFNSTFFYQEKAWTVRVATCPVCRPDTSSLAHDSAARAPLS